jgi:hypothetical protein
VFVAFRQANISIGPRRGIQAIGPHRTTGGDEA